MAFELNNFSVARKVMLNKSENTIECNINAGANVQKVLAVTVDPSVQSSEVLSGCINYLGQLDLKVIFLTDEGQINCVNVSCPFSSKFEGDNIISGQNACINLNVIDYNVDSVSGDLIKISVNIEQSGFIYGNRDVQTIKCDDDDVCKKNEKVQIIKFIGCGNSEFSTSSEISSREKINKVILVESRAIVKDVQSGVNFVTVSGDIVTRIIYLGDSDKFESGYVYDTFKEEVEIEGVNKDSFVEARAFVKQDGIVSEIVDDEKGGKITINIPIILRACAFGQEEVEIIKDLYSTSCDLSVTTSSFEMSTDCCMKSFDGKIEGSLVLEEDKPRVDKILLFGGNNITITNSYVQDGEIYVEGIAKTSVAYLNDDEGSINSAQLEVPFSLSDKFDGEISDVYSINSVVCDVDVVVKKGRELFYDAKVKICINHSSTQTCGVISEVEKLDEIFNRDYAMEVVFAKKGEDVWDIAKKAKVSENQILNQNSEVTFPLEQDSSLIVFYQKNLNVE